MDEVISGERGVAGQLEVCDGRMGRGRQEKQNQSTAIITKTIVR